MENEIQIFIANPNDFGTIEDLSSIYSFYENWPDTTILPFSKADVLNYEASDLLEKRSFQSDEVKKEFEIFFKNLNSLEKDEKDTKLKEYARSYHIKRTAYLVKYYPDDPIELTLDKKVIDGNHRIMAAIAKGFSEIKYFVGKSGGRLG